MVRKFKNSKQRKAVMAKLSARNQAFVKKNPGAINMNFKDIQKKGHFLKFQADADKDGVPNIKDCKPLNPKKQGLLHDLQVKILRKKEEKLERQREKEQKKLEDLKDRLKEKQSISAKKAKVTTLQLKQKQAVIDEINREQEQSRKLKDANREAQRQLDRLTVTGRTKTAAKKLGVEGIERVGKGSRIVLEGTKAFLQSKQTKRTLKKINKAIFG